MSSKRVMVIRHAEKPGVPADDGGIAADGARDDESLLRDGQEVAFITQYLKDDLQPLISDILSRNSPVLICWEHKRIPGLVGLLPNAPDVPHDWPDDRFDLVWVLDRMATGWSFSQLPQLLLSGDSADPIS